MESERAELTAELDEAHDTATKRISDLNAQVSRLQKELAAHIDGHESAAAEWERRMLPLPELQAENTSLTRRLTAILEEAKMAELHVDELKGDDDR